MKTITKYIIIFPFTKESTIYIEDYILMDEEGETILLFDDFHEAELYREEYLDNKPYYTISTIEVEI